MEDPPDGESALAELSRAGKALLTYKGLTPDSVRINSVRIRDLLTSNPHWTQANRSGAMIIKCDFEAVNSV